MSNPPRETGIIVAGKIPPLHPESWLEPPIVIQATIAPMNLIQIGAFTGIYGGKIGHCRIGRYCSIAPGVDIASDQHPIDWLSSSMIQYVPNVHGWGEWLKEVGEDYIEPSDRFSSNSPVTIGNDVWIGQGVFIKSGITIGDGAVIAAHSVVISDIPPYTIAAGVPAKVKRLRFSDEIIEKLIALQWWNYNILKIPKVNFKDVNSAIDTISEAVSSGIVARYAPNKFK